MSKEEMIRIVHYCAEEGLNKGNLAVADEHFTPDYVVHIPNNPNTPRGPEAFRQVIRMWRAAFPDWHMTIDEAIADGDLVAMRFTTTGTHLAPLMGIPATGKKMIVQAMEFHRFENGKVAETWICDDIPTIMIQLGVIPHPPIGQH